MNTAEAIVHTLTSPNVLDSNMEAANVVDAIDKLARSNGRIAEELYGIAAAVGDTSAAEKVADALNNAAENLGDIAHSITMGKGQSASKDATGGTVGSLTEAVMGATAGLVQIARAIERLAAAVEDRNKGGE